MRAFLFCLCAGLLSLTPPAFAQRAPQEPIDAKNDPEYWKNPDFYPRIRACAGKAFGMENSNNRRFSDTVHRCYTKVTNDPTSYYYNQARVETCYRRQYHAECKMRAR